MDSIEKLDVSGVKTALDKGANPNWVSNAGQTYSVSAIGTLAIFVGGKETDIWGHKTEAEEEGTEILKMLFKAGAKLQPCHPSQVFCEQDHLSIPIAEGLVLFTEALLKNGLSPTKEIEGELPVEIERITPMEIAVQEGRANIIGLLKKYGAPSLEPRDAAQQALIGAAGDHDLPRMEDAIGDGAWVNGSNRQGETALVIACAASGLYSVEESAAILYLLKKGADPAVKGNDGIGQTTALHAVMFRSSLVFDNRFQASNERFKDSPVRAREVIEALLSHGALVSARDWHGQTPLHVAARGNNIVGATKLIEAGAKIMPHDDEGKTPLDYAESAEMIKLLKDHGAKEQ